MNNNITETPTVTRIIHNIYNTPNNWKHSITLIYSDGTNKEGKRVSWTSIARNECYAASTAYFPELPDFFKLESVIPETSRRSKLNGLHLIV